MAKLARGVVTPAQHLAFTTTPTPAPSETLTKIEFPAATTSLRVAHGWANAHALPEFSM